MLNYYETLEEVISDFCGKESAEKVKDLRNECRLILKLDSQEKLREINEIISNIKYIDIKAEELKHILQVIDSKI